MRAGAAFPAARTILASCGGSHSDSARVGREQGREPLAAMGQSS